MISLLSLSFQLPIAFLREMYLLCLPLLALFAWTCLVPARMTRSDGPCGLVSCAFSLVLSSASFHPGSIQLIKFLLLFI